MWTIWLLASSPFLRAASCKKLTRKNKLIRKNKLTRKHIFRYKMRFLVELFFLLSYFFLLTFYIKRPLVSILLSTYYYSIHILKGKKNKILNLNHLAIKWSSNLKSKHIWFTLQYYKIRGINCFSNNEGAKWTVHIVTLTKRD